MCGGALDPPTHDDINIYIYRITSYLCDPEIFSVLAQKGHFKMYANFIYAYLFIPYYFTPYCANYICAILVLLAYSHKYCACINNQLYGIIESVDSISRDERDVPLTQYITNAGISRARNTSTRFKHHHRVLTCAKFKVWMTIVESGWNVRVWLVGVVSRRWVWLVGMGGIYGCG